MRVLLVEDELLIAVAMQESLEDHGFEVVGPYKRVKDALRSAEEDALDGAILDVNLRDELVFPVADALERRGVPFVFCTGYAEIAVIPSRFRLRRTFGKPCLPRAVAEALTLEIKQNAGLPFRTGESDLGL